MDTKRPDCVRLKLVPRQSPAAVYVPATGHIIGAFAHLSPQLPFTVDAIARGGVFLRNVRAADSIQGLLLDGGHVIYVEVPDDPQIPFGPKHNERQQPYTLCFGDEQFFVEPVSLAVKPVAFNPVLFLAPRRYMVGAANIRQIDPSVGEERPSVLLGKSIPAAPRPTLGPPSVSSSSSH